MINVSNYSNSGHASHTAPEDSEPFVPAILIANPLIKPAFQAIPPSNYSLRDALCNFFARPQPRYASSIPASNQPIQQSGANQRENIHWGSTFGI
jgi:hypothetical protein